MHMRFGMKSSYLHTTLIFIEWVLLYVSVHCYVVQNVYARFFQVEPITKCRFPTPRVTVGPNLQALLHWVQHVIR